MSQWCRKVFEIRGLSKALVLVILGLLLLVSSVLIPLHSFLPAWGHFEDSYTINPGGRSSLRIGLMSGSTIRVIVAISGGDGYISFSIEDYDGKTILSERLASEEQFFEFQPRRTSFHVLAFENNGPITQSVHWVVQVYYYDTLFQLLGVPLPILGVVMIALGGRKEKQPFAQPVAKLKVKKRLRASSPNLDMDIALVRGIGPKWSAEMKAAGIDSVHELVECSPRDLAEKVGIPEKTASALIGNANEVLLLVKELMVSED